MKIRKMITSMTLAASIAANQVMLTDWGITAHAAVTSSSTVEDITNNLFGLHSCGTSAHPCFSYPQSSKYQKRTGWNDNTTHSGGMYLDWTATEMVLIDPRITGTIKVKANYTDENITNYRTKVTSATNGYTVARSGRYSDGTSGPSGQSHDTVHYDFTYTPTANDIAHGIAMIFVSSQYISVPNTGESVTDATRHTEIAQSYSKLSENQTNGITRMTNLVAG